MGVAQGQRGFAQHPASQIDRKRAILQQLLQRVSGDVLHHEVDEPGLALDPIDRNDVGMVELGRRLGFLVEARNQLGVVRHLRRQYLDCHLALQRQVLGQEHDRHAAPPQQAGDLVAPGESPRETLPQLVGGVGRAHVRHLTRWGAAVGAEAAVYRKRSVALGAVAHRTPLRARGAPGDFEEALPTTGLGGRVHETPTAAQSE